MNELPRRAYLGYEITPDGVVVAVSAAPIEGIDAAMPGDRIVAFGDCPVSKIRDLAGRIRRLPVGGVIAIDVERAGKRVRTGAPISELPTESFPGARVVLGEVHTQLGRLRSIYTVPEAPGPFPLFVFLPGGSWTSVEHPFAPAHPTRRLIEAFSRAGFATLRIERSGMGDSEGPPCTEVDFDTEIDGYSAGLEAAHEQSFVVPGRTVLFGASLGARVAPLIADDDVRAAIVYGASARSWHDTLLTATRSQAELGGMSGAELEKYMDRMDMLQELVFQLGRTPAQAFTECPELQELPGVVREWYRDDHVFGRTARFHRQLQRIDVAGCWRDFERPVLALVGEHDFLSSFEDACQIVDLVGHPESGAFEVPATDHHFKRRSSRRESLDDPAGGEFSERLAQMSLAWLASLSD